MYRCIVLFFGIDSITATNIGSCFLLVIPKELVLKFCWFHVEDLAVPTLERVGETPM